jgi:tetratricopeptide (TPR) repeat protein
MIDITPPSLLLGLLLAAGPAAPASAAEAPAPVKIAPEAPPVPTLADLLKQIEAAYRHKDYALGLSLVKKAYELKQKDVSTMDRIGSVYFVLGRYGEALSVWTQALPLEHDRKKRRELEKSILATRRALGLANETRIAAPSQAPPAPRPAAAVPTATVASAPPAPAPEKALSAETQAQIQAIYKKGVKYYATGQYLQATGAFLRVLELDPENADATKALKRLQLDR